MNSSGQLNWGSYDASGVPAVDGAFGAGNIYGNVFYDLGNTSYYLDPANTGTSLLVAGNVGIGTTSPSTLLNVHGTNPFVRINNTSASDHGIKISYNNSDAHGLHLLYNANSAVSSIDNTYQVVTAQVYGDIRFRQNVAGTMTTRMIIKGDGGNVGIGTTNPGDKFQVDLNSGENILANIRSNGVSVNNKVSFRLSELGTASAEFSLVRDGTSYQAKLQTVNNQPLSFGTNSTTRMVITGANVGIGTLSPYSLLDVQLASAAIRYLTLSTNDGQGSYNGFGLNFRVADGTHDIAQIRGAYENSNGGGYGGLFFATRFAGTLSNRLHINDDGRVGIGVSYGTTLLSVGGAGSTLPASGITFGANSVANLYRSEADHIKTDGSFVVTNTLIVGGGQNGVRILKNGSDSIRSHLYMVQQNQLLDWSKKQSYLGEEIFNLFKKNLSETDLRNQINQLLQFYFSPQTQKNKL
jgi:hypothetical protein